MVYLKVKENSKAAKAFIKFVESLSFVEFVENPTTKKKRSKKEVLNDFETAMKEVKAKKTKPLNGLYNG